MKIKGGVKKEVERDRSFERKGRESGSDGGS